MCACSPDTFFVHVFAVGILQVRVVKRAGAGMAAGGMASALASPTDLIKVSISGE
jgi:hypothetical protein